MSYQEITGPTITGAQGVVKSMVDRHGTTLGYLLINPTIPTSKTETNDVELRESRNHEDSLQVIRSHDLTSGVDVRAAKLGGIELIRMLV